MENAEEIYQFLEDFSKRKPKVIPQELNDYLSYVARTGDPVYQWSLVKSLFKEKLLNVITDFYEITPGLEIPPYPNVDPFNYDTMKNSLLERLDTFNSAPFTVQRICELLTDPRKQYNRIDKFMRAIEKNILVVSTREPGVQRPAEPDNEVPEPVEPIVNGSDNSEYNVDVEMEDVSWKENPQQNHVAEPQPSSSDQISVVDIEARLQAKETPVETTEKSSYESLTPPELNVSDNAEEADMKGNDEVPPPVIADVEPMKEEDPVSSEPKSEPIDPLEQDIKTDSDMKTEEPKIMESVLIPEIKVDDAEMTEKKINDEKTVITEPIEKPNESPLEKEPEPETKEETQPVVTDESSSDSNTKDEFPKILISDVLSLSSEESSMSSENTDGNSNSPKPETEPQEIIENITSVPTSEETANQIEIEIEKKTEIENIAKPEDESKSEVASVSEESKPVEEVTEETVVPEKEEVPTKEVDLVDQPMIQSDNYSVADVNSELPQPVVEEEPKPEESKPEVEVGVLVDIGDTVQEPKVDTETVENKET